MIPAREELHVVAHFPGRLRVRAERFRDADAAAEIERRMSAEPGVTSATANPITGSLLVIYDPASIQLDRLLGLVLEGGGLKGVAKPTLAARPATPPAKHVRQAFRHLDSRCREAMNGRLDARTAIPAACLVAGLGRFALGNRVIPRWYELAFWSFVTFINLNPREAEVGPHAR